MILVTDRYSTIRRVLASLRSQTARTDIELVLVMPRGPHEDDDGVSLEGVFNSVKMVEVTSVHPMPAARAAGIRAAAAPIIFLGETHSFPAPTFFEALLEAHEGEWDIVVPGISNANPENSLSWASFLIDYGTWLSSLPEGVAAGGPTWNVAYRKSILEEADARLELAMEHGDEMAEWLRGRGVRVYFQPRAHLEHANVSMARWWVEQRFLCGVLVANARRNRWSVARRLVYVAGSPVIPFLIAYRLRGAIASLRSTGALRTGIIAALFAGAVVRTAGEVVGYLLGARDGAQTRMDHYELHKLSFTRMQA